jgi:hypothetical protein
LDLLKNGQIVGVVAADDAAQNTSNEINVVRGWFNELKAGASAAR